MGIRCADHVTPLYPQKLALTSPTGGGRSVGIVRLRTKATEFFFFVSVVLSSLFAQFPLFIFNLLLHFSFFPNSLFIYLIKWSAATCSHSSGHEGDVTPYSLVGRYELCWRPTASSTLNFGCGMVQAIRRRSLTAEVRARYQYKQCGIYGGQNGTRTSLSPSPSVSLCYYLSTDDP